MTQDVLTAASASANRYRPELAEVERWVNAIAVYTAAHYHSRARHRHEELRSDPPERPDETPSAEILLSTEQRRLELLSAVLYLPPGQAAVILEHDIDEETMATVAEGLGVPLSTLYKWRRRAFAALLEALRPLLE